MKQEKRKKCPVCKEDVIGRSDKVFCCDECRTMYWNARYNKEKKIRKNNNAVSAIEKDLASLAKGDYKFAIKIIALVTRFCKILYKFETLI